MNATVKHVIHLHTVLLLFLTTLTTIQYFYQIPMLEKRMSVVESDERSSQWGVVGYLSAIKEQNGMLGLGEVDIERSIVTGVRD